MKTGLCLGIPQVTGPICAKHRIRSSSSLTPLHDTPVTTSQFRKKGGSVEYPDGATHAPEAAQACYRRFLRSDGFQALKFPALHAVTLAHIKISRRAAGSRRVVYNFAPWRKYPVIPVHRFSKALPS